MNILVNKYVLNDKQRKVAIDPVEYDSIRCEIQVFTIIYVRTSSFCDMHPLSNNFVPGLDVYQIMVRCKIHNSANNCNNDRSSTNK